METINLESKLDTSIQEIKEDVGALQGKDQELQKGLEKHWVLISSQATCVEVNSKLQSLAAVNNNKEISKLALRVEALETYTAKIEGLETQNQELQKELSRQTATATANNEKTEELARRVEELEAFKTTCAAKVDGLQTQNQ